MTRTCQGVIFESVELIEELIAKTKTKTGLQEFATILDGVCKTGRKVTEEFIALTSLMQYDLYNLVCSAYHPYETLFPRLASESCRDI